MRISRALSSWAGVFALAAMPLLAQEAMRPVLPRITQAIDETELFPLRGNTHPLARAANDQGVAPPDLPMERILLLLRRSPEQEAALKQLLEEQQDPASVNYHHGLTPEQFGEQFGPALEDTDRITGWLKSQGFRVDGVANGRNVVEFSGTAAQVERALHTQIHSYFVNGEQHWANAQDPQIPAALSPVVAGIVSLHNFPMKAMHHRAGAFRKTPGDGAWEPAGLAPEYTLMVSGMIEGLVGPYDFATLYNLLPLWNEGLDGTGQRIAVAGRSNIALQDVRNFRSVFGLPAQDPTITLNGADPGAANVDDEFENVSDVEWAGAIAKGAAINLVVSKSTTATDGSALSAQYIVTNNLAPVLNFSYGKCEMLMTTATSQFYNSLWQQAAAEGITVVVASGDGGSAGCDQNGSAALFGLQVNGIASTPYNVAVGGTDFSDLSSQTSSSYWNSTNTPGTLESAKSYVPEMAWNDSCASPQVVSFFGPDAGVFTAEALCNNSSYMKQVPLLTVAGGGGGASSLYSKPSWQSGVGGIPSDGHRDLPDVSLFAGDGMWLHYYPVCQADNGGPCNPSGPGGLVATGGGGTSFGAPAFSGIMALVNQKIGSRQGLANPALYQLAAAEYGSSSSPNSANLQACNASSPQASSNSCVFYDVTAGNIDVPCVKGLLNCYASNPSDSYGLLSTSSTSLVPAYAAGAGYDLATGLGSFNAANLVNNWPSPQPPNPPLFSIGKSHTGNFAQGQTSARYTVTVSNGASAGPTSGAVTVTENPPTGLTVVSMAGSGWSCTGSTCTRSDVLSPGSSYPAITVTVNVASNAPSQVTNQVTVSGGGSGSSTASDVTVIGVVVPPVLSIGKSHTGNFAQGQTSATYTVRVSNGASAGSTNGAVTVTENPPTGLTLVSMAGSGWSCVGSTCTRSDVLSSSSSYPAITVTVNVASNAPSQVTNQVTVSGGGSGSATASDVTNIATQVLISTTTAVTASPSTIATTASTTLTATVTASSGTPTGTVAFGLGSTVLGSPTLTATGGTAQATLVVNGSRLGVGSNSITASYSGDATHSASAASVTVTVTQSTPTASGYTIGTVAGNGIAGSTGDNGLAASAELNGPEGVAMDSAGNLFIADYYNNRVRKVTPAGTISTVAGTGDDGFGGDLGPAIAARLSHPSGVAVDNAGNLFIADYMNNRIRKVTPGGTISTVAGNGTEGYNGDSIPATSAELWLPIGVAVDSAGNLFIAELTGYRIRKVTPAGTISTVAGNGSPGYNDGPATSAGLNFPTGVAVDGAGDIFIADRGNNFIRKVTPAGMMSRVAGNGNQGFSGDGGPATSAALNAPSGVAVDAAGNLFIADAGNNLIRKVTPDGTISTVAGNRTSSSGGDGGPATSAGISSPPGVIVDNAGNLFIADFGNNKIRKLTPIVNITSVTNGASFQNGFASATWVSVFGANLSQTTRLWQDSDFVNGLLPTALSGVSVTINGLPAYVEYISPTQINVLAPDDATVGAVQVQVTTAQGSSNIFTAQKQQFAPAFFTMGGTYAAAQHADYSYVGKPGLLAGATSQPAKPGETILIYGTGFGPANPPLSSAQLVTTPALLANSVQVTIGGVTAPVDYAGLVGAGLYQFNVRVPNVPSGDAAVVAQIGGVQTQTGVLITIEGSPTPAPQITSVNPASGQVGTAVALMISGANLSGVTAVQFSPSAGITVSNVNATATQVTATVTIAASAAAGSRTVSVSSPAGTSNAVAFTVQTGPGPYDGQWSGSTSQGKQFSMTIANNALTVYSYGVNYPNLGSNCPTGSTTTVYTSSSITESSFSADSISGTFQSATQASGTLNWALIIQQPGCYATGSVTWQATKN